MSYLQKAKDTGWGGPRIGAGRKPDAEPLTLVSRSGESEEPADDQPDLTIPPGDLSGEQESFWREYAPFAVERKTLTPATVAAFRLLCELHAKKTVVSLMVDKGALGGLRVYMQLAKQVEALMGRFCLAPFGKPAIGEKPKPVANPWAQVLPK